VQRARLRTILKIAISLLLTGRVSWKASRDWPDAYLSVKLPCQGFSKIKGQLRMRTIVVGRVSLLRCTLQDRTLSSDAKQVEMIGHGL